MGEVIFKDYLPANARIIITYGKEDKVKFSYPVEYSYKKAVWKRAFPTIMGFWMIAHLWPVIYITLYGIVPVAIGLFTWYYPTMTSNLDATTIVTMRDQLEMLAFEVLVMAFMFFYLIAIPVFITYYLSRDKEKLAKWIPKLGYWTVKIVGAIKETIYTSKDVFENKVVLPAFSNVVLDWKPSGDFQKYLEKIEIMEIPFNYKMRRFLLPFITKKVYNEFTFRAVFFFSETPKEGDMKVVFR